MQVQPRDSHVLITQGSHGFCKFSILVAKAEPSALLRALGLTGAHFFNVKIDSDANRPIFNRKHIQPVDFTLGVNVNNTAVLDRFQKCIFCLDGAIVDNLSLLHTHQLCQIVFLFGNHLRKAAQAVKMTDNPGQRIGFVGIANDGIAPVVIQCILQFSEIVIQFLLIDDIIGRFQVHRHSLICPVKVFHGVTGFGRDSFLLDECFSHGLTDDFQIPQKGDFLDILTI